MDKQKEIDKMVEIAREYSQDIANTPYYKGVVTDMTALYEAGYRKAVEVRKETAREILQTIWDRFSRKISDEFGDMASDIKYITLDVEEVYDYLLGDLAEEYGVEVDE